MPIRLSCSARTLSGKLATVVIAIVAVMISIYEIDRMTKVVSRERSCRAILRPQFAIV